MSMQVSPIKACSSSVGSIVHMNVRAPLLRLIWVLNEQQQQTRVFSSPTAATFRGWDGRSVTQRLRQTLSR